MVIRLAAALGALAVALPASVGGAGDRAPVLGRDWKTKTLTWFDPLTLERVSTRSVAAGFFTGPWAWDAQRKLLALSRYDWPQLRIVDGSALTLRGDVRLAHPGTAGGVDAVTWVGANRLLAAVRGASTGISFVLVDASARKVLRTTAVRGTQWDVELVRNGLVALLGPAKGIGGARVAVVGADGTVRTVAIPGVGVGTRRIGMGTDPRVQTVQPGFAAAPDGSLAVAVTPAGRAYAVDLDTLRVTAHERIERSPSSAAKSIEGPQRYATWIGDGLVAVSGYDWSLDSRGRVIARPAGLRLLDTKTWTTRTLEPGASAFSSTAGVLLAYGGGWSAGRGTYVGIRAYSLDGTLRWSLFDGADAYAPIRGGLAYVQRHVGTTVPQQLDVVDPATGTILASRTWPKGQGMPILYAGDADTY